MIEKMQRFIQGSSRRFYFMLALIAIRIGCVIVEFHIPYYGRIIFGVYCLAYILFLLSGLATMNKEKNMFILLKGMLKYASLYILAAALADNILYWILYHQSAITVILFQTVSMHVFILFIATIATALYRRVSTPKSL